MRGKSLSNISWSSLSSIETAETFKPSGVTAVAEHSSKKNSPFSGIVELKVSPGLSLGGHPRSNGVVASAERGESDQELSLVVP